MPAIVKHKKWGPEFVQDVAPSNPRNGLTWFDTKDNELKVWDANSSSWKWAATGSGARFGYVCGGAPISGPTTPFSGIQRIDFPFQSAVALQVGNIEGKQHIFGGGCNSAEHGFIISGYDNTEKSLSTIKRFDFPFQSGMAEVVGNTSTPRYYGTSFNSSQHGFISGGYYEDATAVMHLDSIERIAFPFNSGTASSVGSLTEPKISSSSCNSSQHGYTIGGNDGTATISVVDRVEFPFNSGTAAHVSNMGRTGQNAGSFNSSQYGFTIGLAAGVNHSYVDRFSFPFNSGTSSVSGNLRYAVEQSKALNSSTQGYIVGGYESGVYINVQILNFPFDSGTAERKGVLSAVVTYPTAIDGVDFVTQFV